jgi:hypothetical protein
VTTVREVAAWRRGKAWEFEDPGVRRDNRRAANALRTLANFVTELPDDDPDLWALAHSPVRGDQYELCREALGLLSRFGLHRGTFAGKATPDEVQFRNLLRRIEGQERHARSEAQRVPRSRSRPLGAQPA